jgi:hypothetical protein
LEWVSGRVVGIIKNGVFLLAFHSFATSLPKRIICVSEVPKKITKNCSGIQPLLKTDPEFRDIKQ